MSQALFDKLDEIVRIYEAARRSARQTDWRLDLGPPASEANLGRVESEAGLRLPDEILSLYRWHDGCPVWIVPSLGFPKLRQALQSYRLSRSYEPLPTPTNDSRTVTSDGLFSIFNIDRVTISARVTQAQREQTSRLYLLDLEMDQLTLVARSLADFVDHVLRELNGGRGLVSREHGVNWAHDPFRFSRNMVPIGSGTASHG